MLSNILIGAALILFGGLMMYLAVKGDPPKHTRFSNDTFRRVLTFLCGIICIALGILAILLYKELK